MPAPAQLADADGWRAWSAALLDAPADKGGVGAAGARRPCRRTRRRHGGATAGLAAAWIRHRGAAGVVATGGDGAREVLRALDAGGIALADEVMGGVPLGTLTSRRPPIVTKAGGFGTEDVWFAPCAIRERRFKQ